MNLKEIAENTFKIKEELLGLIGKFEDSETIFNQNICYPLLSKEDYLLLSKKYSNKIINDSALKKLIKEDFKEIFEFSGYLSTVLSYLDFDNWALKREKQKESQKAWKDYEEAYYEYVELLEDYDDLAEENEELLEENEKLTAIIEGKK